MSAPESAAAIPSAKLTRKCDLDVALPTSLASGTGKIPVEVHPCASVLDGTVVQHKWRQPRPDFRGHEELPRSSDHRYRIEPLSGVHHGLQSCSPVCRPRRRSSSNQLSTTFICAPWLIPGTCSIRKRSPSGAASHVVPGNNLKSSCGMPALKLAAVWVSTAIRDRRSAPQKNSSRPVRDQRGAKPPWAERRTLGPAEGNGCA
jgi:hypothetical protein